MQLNKRPSRWASLTPLPSSHFTHQAQVGTSVISITPKQQRQLCILDMSTYYRMQVPHYAMGACMDETDVSMIPAALSSSQYAEELLCPM